MVSRTLTGFGLALLVAGMLTLTTSSHVGAQANVSAPAQAGSDITLPVAGQALPTRAASIVPKVTVHLDNLAPGVVVARGVRSRRNECLQNIETTMSAPRNGRRVIEFSQNQNDCTVTLVRNDVELTRVAAASWPDRLLRALVPVLHAQQSAMLRTASWVYTYGLGGPDYDKLTEARGTLGTAWSYQNVNATDWWGYCQAVSNSTGWWNQGCQLLELRTMDSGPNAYVDHYFYGHFYWDQPPQGGDQLYHHNIYNKRLGDANGIGYCQYYIEGAWVDGPRQICEGTYFA